MDLSFFNAVNNWYGGLNSFPKLIIVDFVIQWSGYILASLLRTEKFYDLFGSITFLVLSYLSFTWHSTGHLRQAIQTSCICVWAFRLGLFLFTRILKTGKDRRFNKIKVNPIRFFGAWTIQGIWVFVNLLPSLLCITNPRQKELGWRDFTGWALFIVGFLIETVADYQKSSFRNEKANQDKFISSGLWALSRHPNYFGEVLLWFGLYVSASSVFQSWQFLTVFCPVLEYLLISKLSGVPFLEGYALKKWGTSPKYQEYLRNTPVLVPFWH